MPNINHDISYLMNNVQIGDDILSPISGNPARINFATPLVRLANLNQAEQTQGVTGTSNTAPGTQGGTRDPQAPADPYDYPFWRNIYNPDGSIRTPANDQRNWINYSELPNLSPTLQSLTGVDLKTAGKYSLLAVLALVLIAIGLFALVAPETKYIEKLSGG